MRNAGSRTRNPGAHFYPRPSDTSAVRAGLVLALLLACACNGASHENIDRWMTTEKGPGRLEEAVGDAELTADLRAHAAQNLVRMDRWEVVTAAFEKMPGEQRQAVLAELVPRLWSDARIEGEMTVPSPVQVGAKDALFDLRAYAEGPIAGEIDEHLIDWLTGGYYAARARQGRIRGARVIRAVGPSAAPELLRVAKSIIGASPDAKGATPKLEESLLLGLAAAGSAEAVEFLLGLVTLESNDESLPQRVFDALHQAYVTNQGLFDVADGKALVPHIPRLVDFAKDETIPARMVNDAIQLVGAAGAPECIGALVGLISFPHENVKFRWVAANAALQCGKATAIVPVAAALPVGEPYSRVELAGALWEPMAALDQPAVVAAQARILLESRSWVARIIGVELLGHLALADSAAADAELIARLGDDKTPLTGWWGDREDVPKAERKPLPALGERAADVAGKLAKLAPGGGK